MVSVFFEIAFYETTLLGLIQMKALSYPESPCGILSFDFDGTLLAPESEPAVDSHFFEMMKQLRERGWIWGINTGRSEGQMKQGFMEGEFPFLPDFLVARERELFTPGEFGRWMPVTEWNKQMEKDHKKFFRKMKKPIYRVKKFVDRETKANWVEESEGAVGVIASDEAEMAEICRVIDEEVLQFPILGYLRNSIYLRFSHKDYHKGSSLAEVARRTGVGPASIFAVGDGHNDLEMLDRQYAHYIACPNNAHNDIKERVKAQGGYVAKERGSKGVIEALRYFFFQ